MTRNTDSTVRDFLSSSDPTIEMEQPANETNLHIDAAPSLRPAPPHLEPDVPTITDMVAQLQVSASVVVTIDAVASVFTDRSLLSCIGSFQPDPLAFLAAYKLKLLGPKRAKKDGAAGCVVKEAIAREDLDGLKKIYSACRLDSTAAEKPELSFKTAMDVAASEGRLTILQWLYARSQLHPIDVQSSPGKMTLGKILRTSRMDVVHCLIDLHDQEIDSHFLDLLADALRNTRGEDGSGGSRTRSSAYDPFSWSPSLLQLLVRQRPTLHSRILEISASVGSMAAVSYMLSSRSGVDKTKIVMLPGIIAAARGGHKEVIDVLLSAKHDGEVVNVVAVREQLSGVGDAGTLRFLLELLAQRYPSVQAQLDKEREAASAIFGFESTSGKTRKTTGRVKRK